MALVVLLVIAAVLAAAVARLLATVGVKTTLSTWPSTGDIVVSALRSLVKPRTITAKQPPALEVTLTPPTSIDPPRLAALLRLADYPSPSTFELPAMFLIAQSFRLNLALMFLPDFPVGVVGSVLARNKTFLARSIGADEKLTFRCQLAPQSVITAKGDLELDLVNTATDPATGEVVWRNRLTVIVLNPKRSRGPAPGAAASQAPPSPPPTWETIERWAIGGDVGRRYGAINGDLNPIHLHAATSALFGFKRPIAHALFLTTRAEATLRKKGVTPSYPTILEAEFKRPTLLPAKLQCCWQRPEGGDAQGAAAGAQGVKFAVMTADGAKEVLLGRWYQGGASDM